MKKKVDTSKIPPSTEETLVLPTFQDRLGFHCPETVYKFSVTSAQIQETVFQINKLCQKIRCEKSRVEENDPLESEKFYVLSSWILFVIGIIILVLGFNFKDLKSTLTVIGTGFIVLPTVISVIIVIVGLTKRPVMIDLDRECHLRVMDLLSY